MVTVIDGGAFLDHFHYKMPSYNDNVKTLENNDNNNDTNNNDTDNNDTDNNDTCTKDRTISDLLLDQIQFADILILNKVDMITSPNSIESVRAVLKDMNPNVEIIETNHGCVDIEKMINTNMFSFTKAEEHAEWFKEEWGHSVPESEEYGI